MLEEKLLQLTIWGVLEVFAKNTHVDVVLESIS